MIEASQRARGDGTMPGIGEPHRPTPPRLLAEITGYLGGGLMLAGATLLAATSWDQLSRPARIAVLAAVTVALLVAGVLVAGTLRPRHPAARQVGAVRFRLAGALLALAAAAAALTAGTIAGAHELFWAGLAGLAVAALGYLAVRSLAGMLAGALGSMVAVGQLLGELTDPGPLGIATGLVLLGLAWAGLAATGVVVQRRTAFAVGGVIALMGAQQPLGEPGWAGWAYGLTFGVALLWLAGYIWQRSVVLLAAGIIGITIAIPEAIWDWTDGAVGGAVIALIAGAVLLVAGVVGLHVGRRN